MGHTIYYKTRIDSWEEFSSFMERVCYGLGYLLDVEKNEVVIYPPCPLVEPLRIERRGEGFVKTNLVEPCHSLYLLILHSVAFFGSIELWEDSVR